MTTIVCRPNGLLLIDEFENGLHWELQPKVWDAVFRLAKDLNVQVFATTHSWDCVKGFHSAWEKDPEGGGFIRLEKYGEDVEAVVYDLETLGDSISTRVEVR